MGGFMIFKISEFYNFVDSMWADSLTFEKVLKSLNFENLVADDKVLYLIHKIIYDKIKEIKQLENKSKNELLCLIKHDKIFYTSKQFIIFLKFLLIKHFSNEECKILISYYIYRIYLFKTATAETLKIAYKKMDIDYLKKYNIDNETLNKFDNNKIISILQDYDIIKNIHLLIKKYHPDISNFDEEYIKIINEIRNKLKS